MRSSYAPLTLLWQRERGLCFNTDGWHIGYTSLMYKKNGNDETHSAAVTSDVTMVRYFPEGPGFYSFWLVSEGNQSPIIEAYVSLETDSETYEKIFSRIISPIDDEYMKKKIAEIRDANEGYTYSLVKAFREVKNVQEYERKSFYQLILAAEQYENIVAISCNKMNCPDVSIHYAAQFSITPFTGFTSVNVFKIEDGEKVYVTTRSVDEDFYPSLTPDTYYLLDFYIQGEMALELIHYQFDDEGAKFLWESYSGLSQDIEIENSIDDTELSYLDIELEPEDKSRIVIETQREPVDFIIDRVKVERDNLDDRVIHVTIPDYDFFANSKKDFYLALCETDLFENVTYDCRYKINARIMTIDTRSDYIDDEILLYIKDSDGKIVSKFARFDIRGEMDDYRRKRQLVENLSYAKEFLSNFQRVFGAGNLYNTISDIVTNLSHDYELSARDVRDKAIFEILKHQELSNDIDNVIFFIHDQWLKKFNYSRQFFSTMPILRYSEGEVAFYKQDIPYEVCALKYDTTNGTVARKFFRSDDTAHAVTVNVAQDALCVVFAINLNDYHRSGFVAFNNIGDSSYYRDQLDMEVDIYNG